LQREIRAFETIGLSSCCAMIFALSTQPVTIQPFQMATEPTHMNGTACVPFAILQTAAHGRDRIAWERVRTGFTCRRFQRRPARCDGSPIGISGYTRKSREVKRKPRAIEHPRSNEFAGVLLPVPIAPRRKNYTWQPVWCL